MDAAVDRVEPPCPVYPDPASVAPVAFGDGHIDPIGRQVSRKQPPEDCRAEMTENGSRSDGQEGCSLRCERARGAVTCGIDATMNAQQLAPRLQAVDDRGAQARQDKLGPGDQPPLSRGDLRDPLVTGAGNEQLRPKAQD